MLVTTWTFISHLVKISISDIECFVFFLKGVSPFGDAPLIFVLTNNFLNMNII